MTITTFDGEFRFLSNFFPVPGGVMLDGQNFPTVEHAYQASKTVNESQRRSIQSAPRPGIAKAMGRQVTIRDGWGPEMKLESMENLLRQKFSVEPLRTMLLRTDDLPLAEGNDWGDTFWGIFKGRGENHLGKLLMKIRDELRAVPEGETSNGLSYKGFTGVYEPRDGGGFFGTVSGLGKDVATFESDTEEGIEKSFQDSVDDYLEMTGERSNA
jgi:ribA/ribD-fused uncharacterized protein